MIRLRFQKRVLASGRENGESPEVSYTPDWDLIPSPACTTYVTHLLDLIMKLFLFSVYSS